MTARKNFDVIIIGGSYAGLSAAMSLGRSLRKVLIIDSGSPCNRFTPHSHNFITHDGEKPAVITEIARAQVLNYGTVTFHSGLAVAGKKNEEGFLITTDKDEVFGAKMLVFATGIKDIMPDIKGFAACWGTSVIHCPYCHGYEMRNMKTGIIANGDRAYHLAGIVNNLTDDLTILTNERAAFTSAQISKLHEHHIEIVESEISEVAHENGHIRAIRFKDESYCTFDAVYGVVPFEQHCDIPATLGCGLTQLGHIQIDGFYKTTIDGIYACGDNTSPMRSVANAISAGNMTGAMVNKELTDEQFR